MYGIGVVSNKQNVSDALPVLRLLLWSCAGGIIASVPDLVARFCRNTFLSGACAGQQRREGVVNGSLTVSTVSRGGLARSGLFPSPDGGYETKRECRREERSG